MQTDKRTTSISNSALTWHGDVFVGDGFAVYLGPLAATSSHQHHALQLMFGAGTKLALRHTEGLMHAHSILIDSGAIHAIAAPSGMATLIYLEPVSVLGSRVRSMSTAPAALTPGLCSLDGSLLCGPPAELMDATSAGVAEVESLMKRLHLLAPLHNRPPLPPALTRMLERLPSMLDGPVRLKDLAAAVHVSPDRLSHLVRQHLGTTVRAYVRWLRLRTAARSMAQGVLVTTAAHAAGFSDSAHLNRVFRQTLGITPTAIARVVRWHVMPQPSWR